MSKAPKPVARAEAAFYEAQDALNEFKEENEEFMTELARLVDIRERARERLIAAVTDHRFGAGGLRISRSVPRVFDGELLFTSLPKEIRDEVVTVNYKVDRKKFDRAVEEGRIDQATAEAAVSEGEEKISLLGQKKIASINLG